MDEPEPNETWLQFAGLLEAAGDSAGLHRVFPTPSVSCSTLDALRRPDVAACDLQLQAGNKLHQSLSTLLAQLAVFRSIGRCPILAITGLLNAGKSSLLTTYLSPENQKRVLRGLGNQSGTHRFVLWLPEVWKQDAELFSTLINYITSLFGHAPEHLSEDPELAALQYNGRIVSLTTDQKAADPLTVPLIAYDQRLNKLRLGLVDCPDIQTGFLPESFPNTPGPSSNDSDASDSRVQPPPVQTSSTEILHGMTTLTEHRRNQLTKLGRLCSAFVVVSRLGSLHDDGLLQILATLRDAMPGVPRFLAINRVKARYAPEVAYEQARSLVDRFGIGGVYVAYDFRSALAGSRIPPAPRHWLVSEDNGSQPIFFEALPSRTSQSSNAANSSGETVSPSLNYLHDLGDCLDVGALARESSRSLTLQLQAQSAALTEWLSENSRLTDVKLHHAWQAVAEACYEFMAERDESGQPMGLRLQASPAIVAQMADSLQRTAPAWMQLSLRIDRSMRQFHQALADSASRFKMLQAASDSVTQLAKKFRRGEGGQVVTPTRFADALRSADLHEALSHVPQTELVARCETAIRRFSREDQTLFNEVQLDAWSRQVWSNMTWQNKLWKGTQPLAVMISPLLAAILIPFDGGGTALLFLSTKEFLAAAGIAAVMTPMATGGEALQIVHRETPWRQLSDLFAILCDSLGLPRPSDSELPTSIGEQVPRHLLPSNVEPRVNISQVAISVWETNDETLRQLQLLSRRSPRKD